MYHGSFFFRKAVKIGSVYNEKVRWFLLVFVVSLENPISKTRISIEIKNPLVVEGNIISVCYIGEGYLLFMKGKTVKEVSTEAAPELFLEKVFLKICSKFTGEQPCRGVI